MSDREALVSGFRRELIRETVTMALYIGLSLLAVLGDSTSRGGDGVEPRADGGTDCLGTGRGAPGCVSGFDPAGVTGDLPGEDVKLLLGQIAGGLAVVVLATVPATHLGTRCAHRR